MGGAASQTSQQEARAEFLQVYAYPACAQAPNYQLQQLCARLVLPTPKPWDRGISQTTLRAGSVGPSPVYQKDSGLKFPVNGTR